MPCTVFSVLRARQVRLPTQVRSLLELESGAYIAGVVLGDRAYVHKRSLTRFHDGLAWLAQIGMFLTLGLLILPSRIVPVIGVAVLVTVFLMLVARPLAVYISLLGSRFGLREQTLVGWTGLRGAVPYEAEPVWAGEPVLRELVEYRVPGDSPVVGRQIAQAGLPSGADVVLLQRYDAYVVVRGRTRLRRDGGAATAGRRSSPPSPASGRRSSAAYPRRASY